MQYRRFGRTNLKIPILSLGGMRFQKSWDQLDFSAISYEEQNKLENILNLANKYGLSHVETAKYYGTSEVQLGMGFKNTNKIPNIIQTKIPPNSDPAIFEKDLMASFEKLKVKWSRISRTWPRSAFRPTRINPRNRTTHRPPNLNKLNRLRLFKS